MPGFPSRLLSGILWVLILPALAVGDSAEDLFRNGHRAERQGRYIEAYLLYNRARALDPANASFARAARGVSRGAAQLLAAAGEYRSAIEMAPDSWEFQRLPGKDSAAIEVAEDPAAGSGLVPSQPTRLQYSDHETSFSFRGTVRDAYEDAAEEFGVRVVFHEDIESDRVIRADLAECDFHCVMRALGALSKSVGVPIAPDLLLVVEDTENVRAEFETAALAPIPLDGVLTVEDVTQVGQAVQQILDIRRLQATGSGSMLFLRGSLGKVDMARSLVADLLHPPASARIELQMVTVSRGGLVRAGIDLPSSFPVSNFSTLFGAMPGTGGVERLVGFGGGETVLGVAVGDASVEARLNASSSQSLQTMHLRSAHGAPATFKIGESYPIATAQYSGGGLNAPGPGTPGYIQPPPSITFQDLGLNLSVTPIIHSSVEVTLLLEVAFKFLTGSTVNDVPILANREFQSRVRLRRSEFAIVSGTAVYERRKLSGGLSGLGNIPWLGALFRRNERVWSQRDLLILVRPRVVRLPPSELARTREFLFGSEERPVPAL